MFLSIINRQHINEYLEGNSFHDINNRSVLLIGVYDSLFIIIALFLSYKCNNGFTLTSFLVAVLFAPLYIVYRLIVSCKKKN